MIVCVTLNPCLDKTLTVPRWQPGESVRGSALSEVVGGKGNNVARALKRLGRPVQPATFLGGPVGRHCEELLRTHDGFDPIVTATEAPTRTILTVRTEGSPDQTAFFDPDPALSAAEAEDLYHRVEGALAAGPVELLTLSGSSPAPATHPLFSDLIALAQARRVPALLDTYGPALKAIWGFWPEVVKLNRREAAAHLDQADARDEDLLGLLDRWRGHGVRIGVVTDGAGPVLIQVGNQAFRATPPAVEVVNPIGSGDCFLAGIADGMAAGLDPLHSVRRGLACAAANAMVWDAGAIDPEAVRRLEQDRGLALEPVGRETGDSRRTRLIRTTEARRP